MVDNLSKQIPTEETSDWDYVANSVSHDCDARSSNVPLLTRLLTNTLSLLPPVFRSQIGPQ